MHRSRSSYVLSHRPLIARSTLHLPRTTGHQRRGMRRTRCHRCAAAWSHSRGARDGHVHGGSPESRHGDSVARGMATLACGEGVVETARISVRMGLRTAPWTTAAHRACAPTSHLGPAHRAAPLKKPGPPLPHPESSSPEPVHGKGSREPVSVPGKAPARRNPGATSATWRQTRQLLDGLAHPTASTRTGAPSPGWPVDVVGDTRCAPPCRDRGWPLQRPRSVPG